MLERFADASQLIAVALATFIVPAAFLALVGLAWYRRSHGGTIGAGLGALVAFAGGLSLGTLLLLGSDPVLAAPIFVVAGAVFVGRWRARRRTQAGLIAAGVGLPLLVVWSTVSPGANPTNNPEIVTYWAAAGAILVAIGVIVLLRGDPRAAAPSPAAPAGQPGSRAIGSVAAAIREPNLIGPFGQPEIAMLAALVATVIVVPLVLPRDASLIVRVGVTSVIAAFVATEVYVRTWSTRSRRAFEAFSWLGEVELARFKRVFGGGPPVSAGDAERWLRSHPQGSDPAEASAGRVEVLVYANRIDEARALVGAMSQGTPAERFEHAALVDFVEWRAGAVDPEAAANLEAMQRAALAIEPADGDERLLAEVTVATAKVRRLMADERPDVAEAVQPFLEVRERLGHRADGQLGRALRPRILPALLLASIVFGVLFELAFGLGGG